MQQETASADAAVAPRPRTAARRRAFLDAARAVFLDKGYANATLDDVIARSGGSRQTLYALFGGKQGLFEALVADVGAQIFGPLGPEGQFGRPPEEMLTELGVRYLDLVTAPDTLGVYRMVVAEGMRMPELAERFWAMGPGRLRARLAGYLAEQVRRGVLRLADPDAAGSQFAGMLLGSFHMQCALGLRERPGREEIAWFVQSAVMCFLDGCRVR
jgi:AcrR family transcriptional regulator